MKTAVKTCITCAALLLLAVPSSGLAAPTRQRPIEDFVAKQGTYCVQLAPGAPCFLAEGPIGNILAFMKWTDGYRRFARVDYAALVDRYLEAHGLPTWGTTYDGSITERPLPDGRAEVSVRLHTRNTPGWVTYRTWNDANGDGVGTGSELSGPTLKAWGHTASELASGAYPALVNVEFHLVFVNIAMGAPMPDMTQFSFDPAYIGTRLYTSITASGAGELAADAATLGLGAPGAPADLVLHQVGLFEVWGELPDAAEKPAGHEGIWNNSGWPTEVLELKPFGDAE
jgi:hypothetical protein